MPESVTPISPRQVEQAKARLPVQANSAVRRVLENARRLGCEVLVEACRQELRSRGGLDLNDEDAAHAARVSTAVADKSLRQVIEISLRDVPAKPEERLIIRWIAQHPGASCAAFDAIGLLEA